MEMIGKIRRMYFRDKMSLHEITKRTSLSRNTIRKWLRNTGEVALPSYQRSQVPGKLTAFHEALELALKADSLRHKQNRRTGKDLFAQIKLDGYQGGYSRVTDFIRGWREREGKQPRAFVPLKFELGEAFQFDWSEEGLVIGGIYRRMQVSHLKLCASRAFWLVAYPSQGHEMLFDAHTRSFTALGGIPDKKSTEVTTELLCEDGQSVFIGGLIKRVSSNVRTGIPVLGDIPGIGKLFSSNAESVANTETVVIITPRIVYEPSAVTDFSDEQLKRIEQTSGLTLDNQIKPVAPA